MLKLADASLILINPSPSNVKHQTSSQQNYWTIKTVDNLSGSVKLIFVECCEFSWCGKYCKKKKKNHDFLLLGSISVWSNSSILRLHRPPSHHTFPPVGRIFQSKSLLWFSNSTTTQYCYTMHCSHNIIIQMIELMTKNRNTKIYNFLCFKSHYGCSGTACGFPYDSFAWIFCEELFSSLSAKKSHW